MQEISLEEARRITDATLLRAVSDADMRAWAEEMYGLSPRTVCVFPAYLPLLQDIFRPATVISFPHGADGTRSKLHQIEDALEEGAAEIDIVAPLYLIFSNDWQAFRKELGQFPDAPIKLILETSLWSPETIARAAKEAVDCGISTLKTSTGSMGGATPEAVRILAESGAKDVKASGGIRSLKDARKMHAAGATILGSSNIEEWD